MAGEETKEDGRVPSRNVNVGSGTVGVGILGAGNFAKMVLAPKIAAQPDLRLVGLCSAKRVSAAHLAKKYGFEFAAGDENEIFDHPEIDVVFSITQHNLLAQHVIRAIETGKHCFVEKPLCLTVEELQDIEAATQPR